MCPIVCCTGSCFNSLCMLNSLCKWLDYWLQKVKPLPLLYFHVSILKDSDELIDDMMQEALLGPLSPGAKLFTTDTTLHVYKYRY